MALKSISIAWFRSDVNRLLGQHLALNQDGAMDLVFLNFEGKTSYYSKLHYLTYTITCTLDYPNKITINIDGLGRASILQTGKELESNIVFRLSCVIEHEIQINL